MIGEHTTDNCPTNEEMILQQQNEMIREHTTDKCPTNADDTRIHNR